MRRKDVLHKLAEHRQALAEEYGVSALYLFGSVARDQAGPGSDVDLLVEFKQPVGLFQFIDLQQRLETLLACKVDLGTRRALKSNLKDQFNQEAIRVT